MAYNRAYYRTDVDIVEPTTRDDRPLGELFSDLLRDAQLLVRQEMQLAKVEMGEKAAKAGRASAYIAAGGFIAYAGFLALLAAAIIGLAAIMPLWLSALIVGVVVAVIGYFLIQKGLGDLKPEELAPRQTIDSVKETAQWAKEQI